MISKQTYDDVKKVAKEFLNIDKIVDIQEIKGGHINITYLIIMPECRYIIQQINTHVFKSPYGVVHNVAEVTDYIRKKVVYEGRDPARSVLTMVKSRYNQYIIFTDNKYWRCFIYINNATTHQVITSPEMFEEVGRAVGEFQNLLEGFHTRILDDTIPNFHNTIHRYEHFLKILEADVHKRAKMCLDEIKFIKDHIHVYPIIVDMLERGEIVRRVTHNDTKLNNVMIDDITGKALCLIDLDTVMKGSLLYDYGDALRIGASTASEDEVLLDAVHIDLNLIRSFTRGFLKEVKEVITPNEIAHLYDGYLIMTLEVAMRFLDDYINGDDYFRISHPNHNLDRCRNQIKLVKEIEKNELEIKNIIIDLLRELKYNKKFFF